VAVIEVDSLVISYRDPAGGRRTAVNDVSFRAEPGQVTSLLGPNGAGKTSTLECIEGYLRPTSGTVRIDGLDPRRDHRAVMDRLGIMLQGGGVQTGIRVSEVVELYAAFYADPRHPGELIDLVGLGTRTRSTWRSLSGGEQQRLSLALALVGRPRVACLDEPTAGVDLAGRQVIHQVIRDLCADGVAVLLTTHDLDEAETLSSEIVIIDHGHLVASGSPAQLLAADDADHFTFRARPQLDALALGIAIDARVVETDPGDYRVDAPPTPTLVAAVTNWLAGHDELLGDLRAGRRTLADVFGRLTGEPAAASGPRRRRRRGSTA